MLLETLAAEHAERKLLLEALAILGGKRWASKGLPDSTSSKAATGSTHPVRKQSYDAKKRKRRAMKLAGTPLKSAHAGYEELHIAVRSELALEYKSQTALDGECTPIPAAPTIQSSLLMAAQEERLRMVAAPLPARGGGANASTGGWPTEAEAEGDAEVAFNYRISIGQKAIQVEEGVNAPFEAVRLHGLVTHVIPSPDPQQPPNEVHFVADHAVLESTGKWIPYTCEGNYELWNWDWKFEHEQLVRRRACRAIVTRARACPSSMDGCYTILLLTCASWIDLSHLSSQPGQSKALWFGRLEERQQHVKCPNSTCHAVLGRGKVGGCPKCGVFLLHDGEGGAPSQWWKPAYGLQHNFNSKYSSRTRVQRTKIEPESRCCL
jgi:hypothetical protein